VRLDDLVNAVKSLPITVELTLQHDLGNKVIYNYKYRISYDTIAETGLTIYVVNRGSDSEEAYFLGFNPLNINIIPPEATFTDLLKDVCGYIEETEDMEKCVVENVNERYGIAYIKCVQVSGNVAKELRKVVIAKDDTIEYYDIS
jgi:hypothetical protein